jgi:FkbH-like protein/non-ribosomal peptide synthase protein (TIGR01720 family)/FkbM family methyltransferase
MFSLFAATACRHPRILAFEPIPQVANLLRVNAVLHGLDLKVYECGLADRNGEADFTFYENFSVVSGFQADETEDAAFLRGAIDSALVREGGRVGHEVLTELSAHLVNQRLAHQLLVRPIRRLSDVLRTEAFETIDLLKIDVEKSELALIAGLDESDWAKVHQVVMEIHDRGDAIPSTVQLLERHGFDVVIEEEQDLRRTGVWNLFATRPAYREASALEYRRRAEQIDRNVSDLVSAMVTAVPAAASPFVVVCCPASSFAAADPALMSAITRSEATLEEELVPLGVTVVSGQDALARYNCHDYYDARGDELGHMPYTAAGDALVGTLVARAAHARLSTPAKVAVVDCDNTLWAGVCAEDGPEGVVVTTTHAALQRYLVGLHDMGVLVCLCSKNEPADVWAVFDRHPGMILKRDHILASRINWLSKSQNMADLAAELNLGLDGFVFIDDNPVECAEMRAHAPSVITLQWPARDVDAAGFPEHLWRLDQPRTTAEDTRRSAMYKQEVARRQLQRSGLGLEEFLATLAIEIRITPMTAAQLPRTSQMTQRTNQFNFTTIRRSDAELRALGCSGSSIEVVDVRDRFGEYGLVGAVITHVDPPRRALVVDTFLLSCRVLGKGVEHEVIRHLGTSAERSGLDIVELPLRRTARNTPALRFAEALGASVRQGDSGETVFTLAATAAKNLAFKPTAATVVEEATDPSEASEASPESEPARRDSFLYQRIATELTTTRRIVEALGQRTTETALDDSAVAPPQTALEARLAAIWAEQLRLPQIGIHENFFDVGGDSIIAIQLMSRAAQSGIRLGMRDLFEHPTIAELARALAARAEAPPAVEIESTPDDSQIALTPIQRWFFEKELPVPQHWNMEISARVRGLVDVAVIDKALAAVMTHHSALRFRFARTSSGWQQTVDSTEPSSLVDAMDLRGLPDDQQHRAMSEAASRAHASLDLEAGPLARLVVFHLAESLTQILIVVHHLVIDGVSLRILLGDLETAYRQLSKRQTVQLGALSTSYARWAQKLNEYAQSRALAECEYWASVKTPAVPALPTDGPAPRSQGMESDLLITPSFLTVDETRALLQDLPRNYQTQINDALLAALGRAFYRWSGHDTLLVDLEGHGREALFDDVDLSRTVGWFTTIFPVRLRGDFADARSALLATRATLRQIPKRGIGYGVLRYLAQDVAQRDALASGGQPEVMFNYLGQFDATSGPDTLFEVHDNVDFGPLHGPHGRRSHLFEIIARVAGGRLRLDWMYPRNVCSEASAIRLIDAYQTALRELIGLARMPAEVSPGEQAPAAREIEETCALSPIQELFLAAAALSSSVGTDQWHLTLKGPIDPPLLKRAWEQTVQRHSILRTGIAIDGSGRPRQVVYHQADLEWHADDLRQLDGSARQAALSDFSTAESRRPFHLERAPLMRVALFRTGEAESHLFWTFHHLIIDGWSCPLVFAAVGAAYHALVSGAPEAARVEVPYSAYVNWLATRPSRDSEEFWRNALRGTSEATPLPAPLRAAAVTESGIDVSASLSTAHTAALHDLVRAARVSLNTLVQLAWGLVLTRHSGARDVTFGVAFAGRPPDLPGVETIIGPFVNNLPVRVSIDPSVSPLDAARSLQEWQFELSQHQFTPLIRLERLREGPSVGRLFDSLLVLQSYKTADGLRELGPDLKVTNLVAPVQTNYPLTVLATPGDRLRLDLIVRAPGYDRASAQSILEDLTRSLTGLAASPATLGDVLSRLSAPRTARQVAKSVRLRKAHPTPPRSGLESTIARIWRDAFRLNDIGTDENFFDLGGQSLLMVQVHGAVRDALQREISIVTMFQYPTIRELADHLTEPARDGANPEVSERAKRQSAALARRRALQK